MQKFVPAVCKKLYDNSVIEDQFFIKWHEKKLRLDRNSIMYDKRSQDAMRPLLTEFVGWLQSAEYDDEEAYGEEEKGANNHKVIELSVVLCFHNIVFCGKFQI